MKMSNFNCVEMKRRGAEKIIEKTSKMTPTQELEFWRERTRNLINQKNRLRRNVISV